MIWITRTKRNDYIMTDILQRRHAILTVRLWRLKALCPSVDRHLPLSYLLEERNAYEAALLELPPKWFLDLDLETVNCYNVFMTPSKKQMELQMKCDKLLDEISTIEATASNKDIQSS